MPWKSNIFWTIKSWALVKTYQPHLPSLPLHCHLYHQELAHHKKQQYLLRPKRTKHGPPVVLYPCQQPVLHLKCSWFYLATSFIQFITKACQNCNTHLFPYWLHPHHMTTETIAKCSKLEKDPIMKDSCQHMQQNNLLSTSATSLQRLITVSWTWSMHLWMRFSENVLPCH